MGVAVAVDSTVEQTKHLLNSSTATTQTFRKHNYDANLSKNHSYDTYLQKHNYGAMDWKKIEGN